MGIGLGLSGCAIYQVQEEMELSQVEAPSMFVEADVPSAREAVWTDESWWESFEDPVLTGLIEQGLDGSFSLRGFVARIEQAAALSKQSGATLFPTLNLSAGADAEWDG
ncbi:MAG: hypothetical protein ACKVI3_08600, partial [Verrucomicrobiia bacterium]